LWNKGGELGVGLLVISHQMRKFFDSGGKKWVKNHKNLQKFAFFSKNVQKCALFDPVFCAPLRELFEMENSYFARGNSATDFTDYTDFY
jgi:hypothetical protein